MRRSLCLTLFITLVHHAGAETPAATAPATPRVQLNGPEVLKLDWNTRCPRSADFNDDGLPDIALINQDRSRIEFLLQGKAGVQPGAPDAKARTDIWNPILELSRFQKQPLVIGAGMMSLATGDWNGDGRTDIAYTTDDQKLVLRMHGKESADWTQKKEFQLDSVSDAGDSLLAADVNDDKLTDLVVITQTRILIYRQAGKGEWKEPMAYSVTAKGCSALRAADVNGDGRVDLFCTPSEASSVLVRLQNEEGGFGEEWRLEIPHSQSWVQHIRLGKTNAFGWIQDATGMVEIAKLTKSSSADTVDLAASIRHAIPPSESKAGASAYGDITGDGTGDVIIAEPKAARLWVFKGKSDGSFDEGKEYPSFSGIEVMVVADVDADSKPELLLLSPTEKTIGLAKWSGSRLGYPEIIHQTEDNLLGLTVGQLGESKDLAVVSIVDMKPKPQLLGLRWNAKDKKYTPSMTELVSPPSKISGISLLDANQDGRGDVLLFSSLSPMQILLSQTDPKQPFKKAEGLPDSVTSKIAPAAVTQSDVDGDGKKELIVAKEQLARVITIDSAGKARVTDQFNAPGSSAQLTGVIVQGNKDAAQRRILLIDSNERKLHELRANADGVFRPSNTKSLGNGALDDVRLLGSAASQKLLLLGRQSFEVVPLTGSTMSLERIATFNTELKDTSPVDLLPGNLTGGDTDNIMLIDTKKSRVAEFFRSDSPEHKSWRSFMFFRIFQADPHYRGKSGFEYEPHDYATMDLNGDGKADLCLLAHDRLLLYVQE